MYKECEIKLAIFDQIEWSWKIRKEKQKAFALVENTQPTRRSGQSYYTHEPTEPWT